MIDYADPHGLLKTLISHGVVVAAIDGRPDNYAATCPFDEHPAVVDVFAPIRAQARMDSQWRDVPPEWRPAFNLRPLRGTFHCFGCGHAGGIYELTAQLEQRQEAQ